MHKNLGPGLLESVYEKCFIEEMWPRGLNVASQKRVPISYKRKVIEGRLMIDLLLNDVVIIEKKAVEKIIPLYKAQLPTYLKLSKKPKGLVINFNCQNIKDQMVSLVTEEFAKLPRKCTSNGLTITDQKTP